MSKTTIPANFEKCATCRYWTGTQIPDTFRNLMTYDSNESSKCVCPSGPFRNNTMIGNAFCRDWEARF